MLTCLPAAVAQVCPNDTGIAASIHSALDRGEVQQAETTLATVRDSFPGCAGLIAAEGRIHLARRNYDDANAVSERAIAADPHDSPACALRGQMLTMQGRSLEGKQLLEQAIRIDPHNSEALFRLGAILDREKSSAKAAEIFRKTVALRPHDPRAWDYLALNLEPLGEIASAELAYKRGLAVNRPPLFDSFLDYNYGRLLFKLNRLDESRLHLDRAIELVSSVRAPRYDRAKLNLRLTKYKEAKEDAEAALAIPDPGGYILDLQLYNLLATIYTRLGDNGQAQKYIALAESAKIPLKNGEAR